MMMRVENCRRARVNVLEAGRQKKKKTDRLVGWLGDWRHWKSGGKKEKGGFCGWEAVDQDQNQSYISSSIVPRSCLLSMELCIGALF